VSDLLAEIRAHLDDDGPRLVYADELQHRGDPRGEFIAVQCELARLGYARRPGAGNWEGDALIDPEAIDQTNVRRLRMRENALLDEHGEAWAAEVRPLAHYNAYRFERGFVARVTVDGRKPIDDLLDAVPMLDALDFGLLPANASTLAAAPIAQVRELDLPAHGMHALAKLAAPRLRRLVLREFNVQPAMPHLVGWSELRHLERLELTHVALVADHARELLAAAGPLRELQLRQSKLAPAGAELLAASDKLATLEILGLLSNTLGDAGAIALARCRNLRRLRALDLRKNRIGVPGVTAIGAAFPELRTLDLTGNSLGQAGLEALLSGGGLGKVRELCLQQTQLDDGALAALADSPLLSHVRILSLRSNAITNAGAKLLAKSPHATQLQQINLNKTEVTTVGKQALAALGARVLA
jgi:uncharacterized protein (TIGR02996 family)